jgi:hypothetical protein
VDRFRRETSTSQIDLEASFCIDFSGLLFGESGGHDSEGKTNLGKASVLDVDCTLEIYNTVVECYRTSLRDLLLSTIDESHQFYAGEIDKVEALFARSRRAADELREIADAIELEVSNRERR